MKHVQRISKSIPAQAAILPEGHPSIQDSIKGFIEDPAGSLGLHLNKGE